MQLPACAATASAAGLAFHLPSHAATLPSYASEGRTTSPSADVVVSQASLAGMERFLRAAQALVVPSPRTKLETYFDLFMSPAMTFVCVRDFFAQVMEGR